MDDATDLARMVEFRSARSAATTSPVPADVAVAWLRNLVALSNSDGVTVEAKLQLLRAVYGAIDVTREGFARIHLTAGA